MALVDDTEDYISSNYYDERPIKPMLTGPAALLGAVSHLIIKGQIVSLAIAAIIIFMIMSIVFRSFIGGILAATSGILISVQQAIITPVMGWKILIPLFAAVIVGGIGNPIGALMGGLLIGITGELATGWINPSYKPAVYFLVLLIVLLLRPNGILGSKGRQF